jgi:hypothetical protein
MIDRWRDKMSLQEAKCNWKKSIVKYLFSKGSVVREKNKVNTNMKLKEECPS